MKKLLLFILLIVGYLYCDVYINNDNEVLNNKNKTMQLIFVYNAKSGFINGIFDYVHKFVSPETYSCNLCGLTYDNTGKKDKWSNYLNSLSIEVIFAYKDNLQKEKLNFEYNNEGLPCVFLLYKGKQTYLISDDEINSVRHLNELIRLVDNKLSNIK